MYSVDYEGWPTLTGVDEWIEQEEEFEDERKVYVFEGRLEDNKNDLIGIYAESISDAKWIMHKHDLRSYHYECTDIMEYDDADKNGIEILE